MAFVVFIFLALIVVLMCTLDSARLKRQANDYKEDHPPCKVQEELLLVYQYFLHFCQSELPEGAFVLGKEVWGVYEFPGPTVSFPWEKEQLRELKHRAISAAYHDILEDNYLPFEYHSAGLHAARRQYQHSHKDNSTYLHIPDYATVAWHLGQFADIIERDWVEARCEDEAFYGYSWDKQFRDQNYQLNEKKWESYCVQMYNKMKDLQAQYKEIYRRPKDSKIYFVLRLSACLKAHLQALQLSSNGGDTVNTRKPST